ncbi:MAG TPA: PilZ domain-containing protein [Terriglobia bacterium]|nr:PilZ domain-containing protein [Terriglobia bacterium]
MQPNTAVIPRRWERQEAETPIRLVLDPAHFKSDNSAVTLDISIYGARVRTSLELAPGDWVGVIAKGDFPHAIPARVVWSREDEYSHWTFAGLEFIDEFIDKMAA